MKLVIYTLSRSEQSALPSEEVKDNYSKLSQNERKAIRNF